MKLKAIRQILLLGMIIHACGARASTGPQLSAKAFAVKPKLVVVVVIDQFRADYLTRFNSRFLPARGPKGLGGFKYLTENGAYFPFAEYEVLQNITCPGHASILSGAYPSSTHIPLNEWWDAEKQRVVYCTEDDEAPLVGGDGPGRSGASPRRLATTTVGDELKNAGHASRIVGIALKDRAAIMLGGHRADLALWFDAKTYRWISSEYYLPQKTLPAWVTELNGKIATKKSTIVKWTATGSETGLSIPMDTPFERSLEFGNKASLASPIGVDLTTEAALSAVRALKLGQGKATDLLAVSYSSHDMLGHPKGPNSRDMEELTVAEDRSIAELLRGLAQAVPGGLKNVVIALTADHGVAPMHSQAAAGRLESGIINQAALVTKLNQSLVEKFGALKEGKWIEAAYSLHFYLNRRAIQDKKLAASDVENELKALLLKEEGFESAFTLGDFRAGKFPAGMHGRQVAKSYIPGASGDVVAIPKAFFAADGDVAAHMTGYSYDRTVPLVIAGPHLRAGVYAKTAHVIDLAPTLSFLLGVLPPAHAEGRVLSEAIGVAQ